MGQFSIWLENQDRAKELQRIWEDAFKALGIGGLSDEDAANQSLSRITFNDRGGQNQNSTFKGKNATLKRLENGQIFQRLQQLGDPEIAKAVEDTKRWLGQSDDRHPNANSNGSTTVATLLQKLFGQHYQQLIDSDMPQTDAKPQVPPQPPRQVPGPDPVQPGQTPGAQPDATQQPQMPPVQPQVAPKPYPPQTNPPMDLAHFENWLNQRRSALSS